MVTVVLYIKSNLYIYIMILAAPPAPHGNLKIMI